MSLEHPVRVRATVHGRVQGVGFRAWTRGRAAGLRLRGTVRNLPDGSVEVVVEGKPSAVGRLVQDLHDGPAMARVARVECVDEAPGAELPDMRVGT